MDKNNENGYRNKETEGYHFVNRAALGSLGYGEIRAFFLSSPKFHCFFVFLVGVLVRGIPELMVSRYPIGYETITYYAPLMVTFQGGSLIKVLMDTFRAGPLFYGLMWLVANISGAHAFLILKVVGPVLYGGLALSFFIFLKRGLQIDERMAIVATVLLICQIAALRESWDRFRNILGLSFLFSTLTLLKSAQKFKWPLISGLAILTTLSREYIAVVLFVTVLGFSILERKERKVSLGALVPAFLIFSVMVYFTLIWWRTVPSNPYALESYSWAVQDTLSIFLVCFLPLFPFVLKGWFRHPLLDPMLAWLLVGSFSAVVFPWIAVHIYQRWQMLLVFPFTIYAIKGFDRFQLFVKARSQKLVAILLVFIVLGIGYSSGAFSSVVLPNSWVPVNFVRSSIAWEQIPDVQETLEWMDDKGVSNSALLVEERFWGWTLLYLSRANKDITIVDYGANSPPTSALKKSLEAGFHEIYLIWYTEASVDGFRSIYAQNDIEISQYWPSDGVT